MTLTKQALSEALAQSRFTPVPVEVMSAARFTERLLPGKSVCEHGETKEHYYYEPDVSISLRSNLPCPGGTGQLWDEGLVEVVATVLSAMDDIAITTSRAPGTKECARAVLAALAEEVGR